MEECFKMSICTSGKTWTKVQAYFQFTDEYCTGRQCAEIVYYKFVENSLWVEEEEIKYTADMQISLYMQ